MSTYTVPFINDSPPQIVDSGWYTDIRFDPNSTSPLYIGLHTTKGASTSDPNWKIYYFSADGTRIENQVGAWSNRAGLVW